MWPCRSLWSLRLSQYTAENNRALIALLIPIDRSVIVGHLRDTDRHAV